MGKTLKDVAQQLISSNKKVQLIYAFNGTGKTRLSREFKDLIGFNNEKMLYYNIFTEDLFYWINTEMPVLKIHPNSFTPWVFIEQGLENKIIDHFQSFTNKKLTPHFNAQYFDADDNKVEPFSEITFSFERGNNEAPEKIKISRGEESNFIWCVFYSLLDSVIDILNTKNPEERETNEFDKLEYIFIDDPVSSLDDNHLIEVAVNLAQLIKNNESLNLKFIITTHNPLFFNVLHYEFNQVNKLNIKYLLKKHENGEYELQPHKNDSPFSYHLFLKSEIEHAIKSGTLAKYHFNFLRNIFEKTAIFLGYSYWGKLLSKTNINTAYEKRLIDLSSHSKQSGEEIADITESDKQLIIELIKLLKERYCFNSI